MKFFLFDIGNVLCDFNIDTLLKNYEYISGKPVSIYSDDDQELYNAVESGLISDEEYVQKVNKSKNINWSVEDLISAWEKIFSENTTGRELFHHTLSQGTPTYMLSNIAEYHIKAIERNWPRFLSKATGHFFSFQMGVRKPNPSIYQLAISKLEVNPEQCFFIDDMEENIIAAQEIGINAYQFIPENYSHIYREANLFFDWNRPYGA